VTHPVDPPSATYAHTSHHAAGPATAPTRVGNPLGLIALILGVVVLVLGVVMMLVQASLIAAQAYEALEPLGWLNTLVSGVLGAAAIVLGAVGLAQRGRPQAVAGIGLGIGVAVLVSVISGMLYTLVASSF